MKLTLAKIGSDPTVTFAQKEISRYLKLADPTIFIDERTYESRVPTETGTVWIGMDGSVPEGDRDEIMITIRKGDGIIAGSSPRAVLIAAYRFLREIGLASSSPGKRARSSRRRNGNASTFRWVCGNRRPTGTEACASRARWRTSTCTT